MGIAKGMVSLLCEVKREIDFGGSILQLGKQKVFLDRNQLNQIFKKFDFLPPLISDEIISDESLFKALGFNVVESLDVNKYEGADIIHDFNKPVPHHLKGKYDVVFDGGTLEHIFDFPQSLRNIYDLLKPNGIIIHGSPSHNHVDHGFYMFSPTVFYDYYSANNFGIVKSYIFEYKAAHDKHEWMIYNYAPGEIDHMNFGGWGTDLLGIFFVARKVSASSCDIIPQQGAYLKKWGNEAPKEESMVAGNKRDRGIKGVIKSTLKLNPQIYKLCRLIYRKFFPLKQSRPRVIARY